MTSAIETQNAGISFMPHGTCYLWQSDILYLHVISDGLTALAYYSIPLALLYFVVKRKGFTYHWMITMFAVFILACGTTHLAAIWTIWEPYYWIEGMIKAVTALVSIITAVALWYIMPDALALPSPTEMARFNKRLKTELSERKRYQKQLKRAHSRLKQQVRFALVSEMNERLQSCSVVSDIKPIVTHYLPRLLPETSGGIYVFNESRTLIELVVTWGMEPPITETFVQDQCWAIRLGSMHAARYPSIEADYPCEHYKNESVNHCICMPLMAETDVIGLMHLRMPEVITKDEGLEDSQQEVTVTTIARHLSLALANLQLRELLEFRSVRDPLTRLYNRRYLEESFERELARSHRSGDHVSVLMADVDHFKVVNDNYGHEAGDAVLKAIARHMETNVRTEDIVARYGGEEFVIIMPGINQENTRQKAEQLREGVKGLVIRSCGQRLENITISIGIAICPGDSKDAVSLLRLADSALYQAKYSGRNRVVFNHDIT